MYCIRKFADCWAVYNLDTDRRRRLTDEEVALVRVEIPELNDPKTVAYYTDEVECIEDKP